MIVTDTISLDTTGKLPNFQIRTEMDCLSKHLIYAIVCRGCNEVYIGSTGNELRRRMTVHRQQTRVPETRQIQLSEHIDSCSNLVPKIFVCSIYQMSNDSDKERV